MPDRVDFLGTQNEVGHGGVLGAEKDFYRKFAHRRHSANVDETWRGGVRTWIWLSGADLMADTADCFGEMRPTEGATDCGACMPATVWADVRKPIEPRSAVAIVSLLIVQVRSAVGRPAWDAATMSQNDYSETDLAGSQPRPSAKRFPPAKRFEGCVPETLGDGL
jgi:hypothetical protein